MISLQLVMVDGVLQVSAEYAKNIVELKRWIETEPVAWRNEAYLRPDRTYAFLKYLDENAALSFSLEEVEVIAEHPEPVASPRRIVSDDFRWERRYYIPGL